jgi:hypothetical protein
MELQARPWYPTILFMPDVLITPPELHQERLEINPSRSSYFKYYIHDSVATLRLQLIGDLTASEVTELNGTWETAKTTLGRRKLVLDLYRLHSADEEGRRWLAKMRDAGAACVPEGPTQPVAEDPCFVRLSLIGRMLGAFRYTRTVKADSVRVTGR